MRLLLQSGVDVNVTDRFGLNALELAGLNGHIDIVKMFLREPYNLSLQPDNGWESRYETAWDEFENVSRSIVDRLPYRFKRAGEDWFAIFNKDIPVQSDISLECVLPGTATSWPEMCFSYDGKYLAVTQGVSVLIFSVDLEVPWDVRSRRRTRGRLHYRNVFPH